MVSKPSIYLEVSTLDLVLCRGSSFYLFWFRSLVSLMAEFVNIIKTSLFKIKYFFKKSAIADKMLPIYLFNCTGTLLSCVLTFL